MESQQENDQVMMWHVQNIESAIGNDIQHRQTKFSLLFMRLCALAVPSWVFFVAGRFINGFTYLVLRNRAGNVVNQAAIGYFDTICFLLVILQRISISENLGIKISKALGNKNYLESKKLLLQGFITSGIIFGIFSFIALHFSQLYLKYFLIEEEIYALIIRCLRTYSYVVFGNIIQVPLMTVCYSHGIEKIFGAGKLFGVLTFCICYYLFAVRMELGDTISYIYGIMITEAIDLLVSLFAYSFYVPSNMKGISTESENFIRSQSIFFYETLVFIGIQLIEVMGFFTNFFYMTLLKNPKFLVAHINMFTLNSLISTFGISLSQLYRTRVNFLMGMKKKIIAKRFTLYFIISCLIAGSILGVIWVIAAPLLSTIFSEDSEVVEYTTTMLYFNSIFLPTEVVFDTIITAMRSIRKFNYLLFYYAVFYFMLNLLVGWLLGFVAKLGYASFVASFGLCGWVTNGLCIFTISITDWRSVCSEEDIPGELDDSYIEPSLAESINL